jgi:hypothetical protein
MKRLFDHIPTKLILVSAACIFLMSSGCSAPKHEGFAIYLTQGDIPPAQILVLNQIGIAEQPIIGLDDIITYNAQTHELKLTPSSYEDIFRMDVPGNGKSFVVCVDRKPVYSGAFWTPVSSFSFDGVTIWKPYSLGEPHIINLELGYPSSSFYRGEDPRNNPEVINSLEQAGKLITKLSITAVNELPRSMKGFELYSWPEDSQWHFTLITGTNRNKTLEEIISNEDFISEAGWIQIQVVGVDAIKAVLSRVPKNEFIVWLAGMRSEQTPQSSVNITLPEKPTIDTIKESAEQCGLDFMVQTP